MTVQKIMLMTLLMVSPSLLCMTKEIVEIDGATSGSQNDQFKRFQQFLAFEEQQKKIKTIEDEKKSTGSFLGDLGVKYFILILKLTLLKQKKILIIYSFKC